MYTVVVRGNCAVHDWLSFANVCCRTDADVEPDALIVFPGFSGFCGLRGKTAVTASGVECDADQLITCGMGTADTLTLSSCSPDSRVLALQRDILTVGGGRVERQEFVLPPGPYSASLPVAAGALLALGTPPDKLGEFLSAF